METQNLRQLVSVQNFMPVAEFKDSDGSLKQLWVEIIVVDQNLNQLFVFEFVDDNLSIVPCWPLNNIPELVQSSFLPFEGAIGDQRNDEGDFCLLVYFLSDGLFLVKVG